MYVYIYIYIYVNIQPDLRPRHAGPAPAARRAEAREPQAPGQQATNMASTK